MRQVSTSQNCASQVFTRRSAPKGISASILVCVVLASGAAFGMAALAALRHFGLDFASLQGDLVADRAAQSRSALAWWSWWLVAGAALFVGPLSVALTRTLVANWWLLRGLRLVATAALVLGLAAVGLLQPAPTTLAFTATAVLGLLVVGGSTLLAALGAGFLGRSPLLRAPGGRRPVRSQPARTFTPLAAAQPRRGGGSADVGLTYRRWRQRHGLAPASFSLARLAVAVALAIVVFAAVSALGGATVLLDAIAPGAVRQLVATGLPRAGAASHARTLALALLPAEQRPPVVLGPVVALAPAVDPVPAPATPKPVEPPAPRQRAISAAAGYGGATIAESELTFTKGYSRRRAAQLAATMTSLPSIPQLTAAIDIKKIRAASLRITPPQYRRASRPVADNRSFADNSFFADQHVVPDSRSVSDKRHRASRHARGQDRHADSRSAGNRRTDYRRADYPFTDYNSYERRDRRDRHGHQRGRDRYGDNRFARAEPLFGRF
jgi:hypothetical protein